MIKGDDVTWPGNKVGMRSLCGVNHRCDYCRYSSIILMQIFFFYSTNYFFVWKISVSVLPFF